jgi:hypothetical protein
MVPYGLAVLYCKKNGVKGLEEIFESFLGLRKSSRKTGG